MSTPDEGRTVLDVPPWSMDMQRSHPHALSSMPRAKHRTEGTKWMIREKASFCIGGQHHNDRDKRTHV